MTFCGVSCFECRSDIGCPFADRQSLSGSHRLNGSAADECTRKAVGDLGGSKDRGSKALNAQKSGFLLEAHMSYVVKIKIGEYLKVHT
jgi:hypothetical protein